MSVAARKRALVWLGLLSSSLLLWWSLRQVDAAALGRVLASVDPLRTLACAALLCTGILLRGERWRTLAGQPGADWHSFRRATQLGLLANLVLPGRAGEVVRIVALMRWLPSSLPRPLASAFVDRLVDVVMLLGAATMLVLLFPLATLLGRWLLGLAVVVAVALVALAVLVRSRGWMDALVDRLAARLLQRWPDAPQGLLPGLRAEVRRMAGPLTRWRLPVLALSVLVIDWGALVVLLSAFGLSLPLWSGLLLWVFLAAGSALPSAPGYVGVYQVAAVWALATFQVPAATAVGVATVLQLVTLAVALLMAGPGALGWIRRTLAADRAG